MNIPAYIINLPFRTDRRDLAISELIRLGIAREHITLIASTWTPSNGAIGCSLGHAKALSEFLIETSGDFALVVEDDFMLEAEPVNAAVRITEALDRSQDWDCILLAHNEAILIESDAIASTRRAFNSLSASAYIVKRPIAIELLSLFLQTAGALSNVSLHFHKDVANFLYAADVRWKELQKIRNFYAFSPRLSVQRESFSDITNSFVKYGC